MTDRFAALRPYFPTLGSPQTSNPDKTELSYEASPDGDGKSVYNPPREGRSHHYDALYKGEQEGAGEKPWWDFHVYHLVSFALSPPMPALSTTPPGGRQIRFRRNLGSDLHPAGPTLLASVDTPQPLNPNHVKYAQELYEAVRREFPELRVYRVSVMHAESS